MMVSSQREMGSADRIAQCVSILKFRHVGQTQLNQRLDCSIIPCQIGSMNIGYARVSTRGQTLESQLEELEEADCSKIYSEKISGAKCDRPELQRLLNALEPGSVIVVTRLDRLARSTIDLLTTIKQIADKRCLFKSLADPWCDKTTPGGRLMLAVLGGLAEFERELIKARTSEGRERAKRAGSQNGAQAET